MKFEVVATPRFERDIKKLVKKYPSLKDEYLTLINELEENPKHGISLGHDCYKVRISIASKGRGKSGGARAITYVVVKDQAVYLLTIFDKSDRETVGAKELSELLSQLND